MTIILDMGTWHIEVHQLSFDLTNAAGQVTSDTIGLDRQGPIISIAMAGQDSIGANDNGSGIGYVAVLDGVLGEIDIGDSPVSIRGRLNKIAGTNGNITISYRIQVIIRDSRN